MSISRCIFFLIAASEHSPPTGIQLWSLSAADVWTCHSRKFRSIIILLTKSSFPGICAVQLVKSRTASVFDRSECEKSIIFKFLGERCDCFPDDCNSQSSHNSGLLNKLWQALQTPLRSYTSEKQLLFLRLWQKSLLQVLALNPAASG